MVNKIKNWLSRYSFKYPRSLVYMLQASEYHISDFLEWYKKTDNFLKVEKRKKLVKTKKALGLLVIAWTMLLLLYALGIFFLLTTDGPDRYLALITLILAPYLLPYLISIKLFFLRILVQKPVEHLILKKTKETLKNHKGLKIGIAGSFGKTTMREIIKTTLSVDKKVAAPPHSYNTPIGISKFVKNLEGDEDVLIFELGEYYPGDIRKLCEIVQPDIGIITGINEAHLKKFKNLENTVETIFEIEEFVREENLYINKESKLAEEKAPRESVFYSKEKIDNWEVKDAKTNLDGTSFVIEKDDFRFEIKSKLIGLHQIGPLALAFYLAQKLGITPEKAIEGISKVKPFEHRLEPKETGKITLIDDSYNGNPDGVRAAINFLLSLEGKRKFYITPGLVEMGDKSKEIHKEIGRQLAKAKIEKVVLIKNSVTPYIKKGLEEENFEGDLIWFDNGPEAYNSIDILTVKGDVVLIQNDWPDQYQ